MRLDWVFSDESCPNVLIVLAQITPLSTANPEVTEYNGAIPPSFGGTPPKGSPSSAAR